MAEYKPVNPYTKRGLIQARVNNEQLQQIVTKAFIYCGGDISKYVRLACLEFKKKAPKKLGA